MAQGLVYGLVIGIAALVLTTMIAFVIVSNVAVVDDDLSADITAHTTDTSAYLNGTSWTVAQAGVDGFVMTSISAFYNASGTQILSGNYTFSTAGVVSNITAENSGQGFDDCNISYYYTWNPTETVADNMIANFSTGVENVSNKIPTILLIAAVVLILSILAMLWQQYQRMNVGSGSSL